MVVIHIKNEPLLFINSPTLISNELIIKKTPIKEAVFEKRIKELVNIYKSSIRVLVEIKTTSEIKSGYIKDYIDQIVYIERKETISKVNVNDITDINIIKV